MRTTACTRNHSLMPGRLREEIFELDSSQMDENARHACPMCCFLAGANAVLNHLLGAGKITNADMESMRKHLAMGEQGFA